MTKMICITFLLCTLLTSCDADSSIGVIGGADGPTAVVVSNKGEKEMYKQITAAEAKKIMDSDE